ncbi:structural maintenance of chromosomes flexible hinge domain-containing protein GMI1-like isoform X2 [Daucus carota subsp. sativus]|uniref:structural maintenance of chromosomes flexible hinge domain-containing protein GMI1-like isoform X2 n=1 Tax=Daucus carota subsp. sativus TaxID=79200 RepID=UPI003083ED7C
MTHHHYSIKKSRVVWSVELHHQFVAPANQLGTERWSKGDEVYENMWDLTPDVELLRDLPQEYAFETALAYIIDNSLQAIWSKKNKDRLIRVDISKDKISIFDNGPGMDASEENSIVKWGKMGLSLHRSSRGQAIGGKPPYLKKEAVVDASKKLQDALKQEGLTIKKHEDNINF